MSAEDRLSATRMRNFKNRGKDSDELRRRRQETSVELRKAKKDDQILKRRNICLTEEEQATSPLQDASNKTTVTKPPSLSIDQIVAGILGSDKQQQLTAVQAARKILSRERNPPIDTMIQAGIVPHCVRFLTHADDPQLQFEAAWALTNIASGTSEQTKFVANQGAVPHLITLLGSEPHVAEQAVWALGNIAGDGPELRDYTINCGIVPPLLALVQPSTSAHFLRNVTWTISNLCRNKNPPPPFETVRECLPALAHLILHTDTEVVTDACWALSYLTDGSNDKIERVIEAGVVPRMVALLGSEASIISPALRTLGNIVTGSDAQTDAVVKAGAMAYFPRLLAHPKPNVVKEAAWTVSNVTAGNLDQIQAVINAGLLQPVLDVLQKGDHRSQREAVWVILNLTSGGSQEQVSELCRLGVVRPLCDLLAAEDAKLITVILDALSNILRFAEQVGQDGTVALQVEECGGLDRIEALQTHENETIYNKTVSIIGKYFSDEDADDEQLAPTASTGADAGYQLSVDADTAAGGFQF